MTYLLLLSRHNQSSEDYSRSPETPAISSLPAFMDFKNIQGANLLRLLPVT